ncbi:MAG: hypothetical protein JW731_13695, partial [Bacteroidales bacterium]|nr:hypothetical protein [Bacteroidales bacterium]
HSEIDAMDCFDRVCLEAVLEVCKHYQSLSEAGRQLYNISRNKKQNQNDADRLSKYLKRFGITWSTISNFID